jgi:hypothetical protein
MNEYLFYRGPNVNFVLLLSVWEGFFPQIIRVPPQKKKTIMNYAFFFVSLKMWKTDFFINTEEKLKSYNQAWITIFFVFPFRPSNFTYG